MEKKKDDICIESIKYALHHIKPEPPVVIVMGHEKCGAVTAAVDGKTKIK